MHMCALAHACMRAFVHEYASVCVQDDHFHWKIELDLAKKNLSGFIAVYGQGMADCAHADCFAEP